MKTGIIFENLYGSRNLSKTGAIAAKHAYFQTRFFCCQPTLILLQRFPGLSDSFFDNFTFVYVFLANFLTF